MGATQRKPGQPPVASAPLQPYTILIPAEGWQKAARLLEALRQPGAKVGGNLQKELVAKYTRKDVPPEMDCASLIEALIDTKLPQIFAESAVYGNGRDWYIDELSLLGDISFAVPCTVYDNGAHQCATVHDQPFKMTLLYTCGALLNSSGNAPADWPELCGASSSMLDDMKYKMIYERRLLPCLQYANDTARELGRKALVTIPGLGCGQFAGPFIGELGAKLGGVLEEILKDHGTKWPHIKVVYYDAFMEGAIGRCTVPGTSIEYIVQPLAKSGTLGRTQLERPTRYQNAAKGDDFADCELFSFVAWDHVSWPGNDYWAGSRATDDGVKAAATDTMYQMTGVPGSYDKTHTLYLPPKGFRTWRDVVNKNKLRINTSSVRWANAEEAFELPEGSYEVFPEGDRLMASSVLVAVGDLNKGVRQSSSDSVAVFSEETQKWYCICKSGRAEAVKRRFKLPA